MGPTLRRAPCNLPCTAGTLTRTLVLGLAASTLDSRVLRKAGRRLLFERLGGQRELHRGPGPQAAGDGDGATHGLDEAAGRVEANATSVGSQAPGGRRPIELLECAALSLLVMRRAHSSRSVAAPIFRIPTDARPASTLRKPISRVSALR